MSKAKDTGGPAGDAGVRAVPGRPEQPRDGGDRPGRERNLLDPKIVLDEQQSVLPGPMTLATSYTLVGWVNGSNVSTVGCYLRSVDGLTRIPINPGTYLAQAAPVQNPNIASEYDWTLPLAPPSVSAPTPYQLIVVSLGSDGSELALIDIKVVFYPPPGP